MLLGDYQKKLFIFARNYVGVYEGMDHRSRYITDLRIIVTLLYGIFK